MKTLPEILRLVAKDLGEIALALEQQQFTKGPEIDWRPEWNTYSLEAYAAVHKLHTEDQA